MSIFDDFDSWNIPSRNSRGVSTECVEVTISRQIFDAASRGNKSKLLDLLEKHPNENLQILINGLNALHVVAKKGHIDVIDVLLSRDPSLLRSRSGDCRDAFMLASFEGRLQVLQVLYRFEAAISDADEAVDNRGNGSLHYAAWGGHLDCVKFLVEECGKSPNLLNHDQISPLQYAAAGNHVSIVEYLSNISVVKDDESISGMSPFHRAAAYGSLECLVAFVDNRRFDANSKTQNGCTALHFAAQHGHNSIVQYLCEEVKVNADEQNALGLTPLHFACIGGHASIVQLLVYYGANPLVVNRSGENAFHIAAVNGNHEICKFLNKLVALDPFKKDNEGKSVVDKALESGFKELANSLVLWSTINIKSQEFMELLNAALT